jgi:hypothetical protein
VLSADPAPAGATAAGAAERHVDVPPAGAVIDDHLTHREFLDEPVSLADVLSEHRCLQAERVIVGDADQLVFAIGRDDRDDRAERLLGGEQAVERHPVGHGEFVVQVRRLPGPPLAAPEQVGAAALAVGHVPVHFRCDRFVVQRAERGARVERIP